MGTSYLEKMVILVLQKPDYINKNCFRINKFINFSNSIINFFLAITKINSALERLSDDTILSIVLHLTNWYLSIYYRDLLINNQSKNDDNDFELNLQQNNNNKTNQSQSDAVAGSLDSQCYENSHKNGQNDRKSKSYFDQNESRTVNEITPYLTGITYYCLSKLFKKSKIGLRKKILELLSASFEANQLEVNRLNFSSSNNNSNNNNNKNLNLNKRSSQFGAFTSIVSDSISN